MAVPPPASVAFFSKKVMLATPWFKFTHPLTSFSVSQLMDRRRVTTSMCFGDSFVAHSRNSIVDAFLKTDGEYLLMIDDDQIVPFGNAAWYKEHTGWNIPEPFASLNALDRLLSHGKTLVGGLYKGRYEKSNFVFGEGADPKTKAYLEAGPKNEIRQTRWVGTGCMLAHRSVFEDIEKRFPRLGRHSNIKGGQWFSSSEHTAMDWIDKTRTMLGEGPMTGEKAAKALAMLESAAAECRNVSTLGVGEDVQLCLRAASAGHPTYVDFGLRVGHIGCKVY